MFPWSRPEPRPDGLIDVPRNPLPHGVRAGHLHDRESQRDHLWLTKHGHAVDGIPVEELGQAIPKVTLQDTKLHPEGPQLVATLLPAVRQGDMTRLKLPARSQLEVRNALYRAKHVLSRVGQQVQDLDDVLDSLQAANFVDVVLRNHPPLVLYARSRVC